MSIWNLLAAICKDNINASIISNLINSHGHNKLVSLDITHFNFRQSRFSSLKTKSNQYFYFYSNFDEYTCTPKFDPFLKLISMPVIYIFVLCSKNLTTAP